MGSFFKALGVVFAIIVIAVVGYNLFFNYRLNPESDASETTNEQLYRETVEKQSKAYEAQLERNRVYQEKADALTDASEINQQRYEKLLSKWEDQAQRFDKILDAMEKKAAAF